MSKNTNPEASTLSKLSELTKCIYQAADNQKWDQLDTLIIAFDAAIQSINISSKNSAQLSSILAIFNEAKTLVASRRNEIGKLLEGISDNS